MKRQDREEDYFFISHSNKDIKKVRIIRNTIEKQGKNPILFYLRCIKNKDELDTLLKREIEARRWFIYCESKNAEASEWVKKERAYIEKLIQDKDGNRKLLLKINVDNYRYVPKRIKELENETLRQINKRTPSIVYWNVDKEHSISFEKSLRDYNFNFNYNVKLNGELKEDIKPQYIILCMQAKESNNKLSLDEYIKDYDEVFKKLSVYKVPVISNILYKLKNGIVYSEFKIGVDVLDKAIMNINRIDITNVNKNNRFIPDDPNDLEMLLKVYDNWNKR